MTVALKGTDFAKSFEMTVRSADKTALNEVIAEAGSDEFEAAFDAAKKVAADEDATPAQVADALAAPQKPAVKPSPNGKVDATEPSGLSKTGASVFCQVVIGQCGVSFPSEKAVGFSPVRNWPVIARVLLFHCIRA